MGNLIKPGEVKNPRGRPKGAKGKTKQLVERLENAVGTPAVLRDIKKVFKKTVEMALSGDVSCQKMLLDRFLPIKRFEGDGVTKAPTITINIDALPDGKINTNGNTIDAPKVSVTDAEIITETKH